MDSESGGVELPTINTEEIPLQARETVTTPSASTFPISQQKPLSMTTVLFTHLENLRETIEATSRRMNYLDISVTSAIGRSEEQQAASNRVFTFVLCFMGFIGSVLLVMAFLLGVMVR